MWHLATLLLILLTKKCVIILSSRQYSIIYKQEQAHDDSIWSCVWRKNQSTGTDNVVTGSVDDTVKLWRWLVQGSMINYGCSISAFPTTMLLSCRTGDRLELRYTLEGHQLGIVSVDINQTGTSKSLLCLY